MSTTTPRPFLLDHAQRIGDLLPSPASPTPSRSPSRLTACTRTSTGPGADKIALDERQMLARLDRRLVDVQVEFAGAAVVDAGLGDGAHEMVVAQPVGDEILDGADLEAVPLREGDEVGHARHGAVVVHDLADDRRRIEPGEARQIDRRFRMAGADQHAALARDEREHVPGRDDVGGALRRVDRGRDGARAIGGRDAGRDALARLDRLREGGAVARAVASDHRFELELGRRGRRSASGRSGRGRSAP